MLWTILSAIVAATVLVLSVPPGHEKHYPEAGRGERITPPVG
jgi:hypothetical protein